MNITEVPKGRYVIAVSGGVDSMTLLDILSKKSGVKLTVAHFDHGIRPDSNEDRLLVERVSKDLGFPFVFDVANLGSNASEDEARIARYDFLNKVLDITKAKAIITAHTADDKLETTIFNLIRGTGRKGITSLQSVPKILRPMLNVTKKEIYEYAQKHNIKWHEDSTNVDPKYSRNYIRQEILSKFSKEDREKLLNLIDNAAILNKNIDKEISVFLKKHSDLTGLERDSFTYLPHKVASEVMAAWLRGQNIRSFNAKLIDKLTIAAKTLRPGQKVDVDTAHFLYISNGKLALLPRDR